MTDQNIQTHRFENGLTLVTELMTDVQSAAFSLIVPSGSVFDPEGKNGSSAVLCDLLVRGDIGRTTDHFDGLAVAEIDLADGQSVRIRMWRALANSTDSNLRKIGPRRGDLDILESTERKTLDEIGFCGEIDEFREPLKRCPHQTCSNTRRSPSKSSRMSGMP